MPPTAIIFDIGRVLYHWEPRLLYDRLIPDDAARAAFAAPVAAAAAPAQSVGRSGGRSIPASRRVAATGA